MAKAAFILLPLLAVADQGIPEALDQDDVCSDPSCALGLLHVRGNATSEGPGLLHLGVACDWISRRLQTISQDEKQDGRGHQTVVGQFAVDDVCRRVLFGPLHRSSPVELEPELQVMKERPASINPPARLARGHLRMVQLQLEQRRNYAPELQVCVEGRCMCNDGYVAFNGKCYKTTTTTTTPETTTGTWPDVVTSKPAWVPPPPPPRPHNVPAPAPPPLVGREAVLTGLKASLRK
ncbi:unnamed protein product [Symbiodinium natans]|uniref:Uncharacterized protein n=1 Tax=Symbiodinium natans TaxID=878477 RepID=A0A812NK41_9DINO|nr:unnamed protein product [Symbiodinium natans]